MFPRFPHALYPAVCSLLVFAASSLQLNAAIVGLGDLPGGDTASWAVDVSADGRYVLGQGSMEFMARDGYLVRHTQPFRWSLAGAIRPIGSNDVFHGYHSASVGLTISGDGFTVGGRAVGGTYLGYTDSTAAYWTFGPDGSAGGGGQFQSIGHAATNQVTGLSYDGSVRVGRLATTVEAFRQSGTNPLQPLTSTMLFTSTARAVSSDGMIVVGDHFDSSPFIWTTAAGRVDLPNPINAQSSSVAGLSDDGSVIVGSSTSLSGTEATLWRDGVPIRLGDLPGGTLNSAFRDVTADGSIAVGFGTDTTQRALLWSEATGLVDLRAYLIAQGNNLDGWVLTEATAISKDGSTIVGNGAHNGLQEGWVVTIPEPSSAALLLCSALLGTRRRR